MNGAAALRSDTTISTLTIRGRNTPDLAAILYGPLEIPRTRKVWRGFPFVR
jgi:hypothetical protein